MSWHYRSTSAVILAAVIMAACGGQTAAPTEPLGTPGPTSTVTIVPIRTPGTPGPDMSGPCNPDRVVESLRPLIPYTESALSHNIVDEVHNLNVWFVDPSLNPLASSQEIPDNVAMASRHAAILSHTIAQANSCVATGFRGITVMVVDRDYNEWYEGQILPGDLPRSQNPSDAEIEQAMQAFTPGLTRDRETASVSRQGPPAGSCTWGETRSNLASHFEPSRRNVIFYIAVDYDGVNIWAQWDGPQEWESFLTGLLNVVRELDCLYPQVDVLWAVYVDSTGLAQLIVTAPGEAVRATDPTVVIDSLEVVYPPGYTVGE